MHVKRNDPARQTTVPLTIPYCPTIFLSQAALPGYPLRTAMRISPRSSHRSS